MDFRNLDTRKYFFGAGAFLTILFAVLQPAGSAEAGLHVRLLQWALQVGIPLGLLIVVHLGLSHSTLFDRLNPWLKLTISGVLGSLLFSPIALALDFLFEVDSWQETGNIADLLAFLIDEALGVVPPVTIAWLGLNAPRILGLNFSQPASDRATVATTRPASGDGAASSAFLKLLPPRIGQDIVYIMSELHYLRVVTTKGYALVLYNLRDAVAELPHDKGFQPHRSYWVVYDHVQRLVTRNGKAWLDMNEGSHVPVSRRRLAEVRKQVGS
jgi:hypothetical protein